MKAGVPVLLSQIWGQGRVAVIWRQGEGRPVRVRLPHFHPGRDWIRAGRSRLRGKRRLTPLWQPGHGGWEVPQAWFDALVEEILAADGRLYVVQPFRERVRCVPPCWNARGHVCECSCMGANHGSGSPDAGWYTVQQAFPLYHQGPSRWACRLMERV